MAELYNNLGKEILLDVIARSSNTNDIETCIMRELARRGIAVASSEMTTADTTANGSMRTSIHNNCVKAGYNGSETTTHLSASQMHRYIAYIKELYAKILVN